MFNICYSLFESSVTLQCLSDTGCLAWQLISVTYHVDQFLECVTQSSLSLRNGELALKQYLEITEGISTAKAIIEPKPAFISIWYHFDFMYVCDLLFLETRYFNR